MRARVCWFWFLVLVIACDRLTAAPFQNLDFEQANTNHLSVDPGSGLLFGSTADLLPGWELEQTFIGQRGFPSSTNMLKTIWFKQAPVSLDNAATATLINSSDFAPGIPANSGKYSLLLDVPLTGFGKTSFSVIQQGDVPADATTLQSYGALDWTGGGTPGGATMNGIPLGMSPGGGWDVSAFDGENVELVLSFNDGFVHRIDGLQFIPEPSPRNLWVVGLGGLAAGVLLQRVPSRRGGGSR
jgi:hypothetical protein